MTSSAATSSFLSMTCLAAGLAATALPDALTSPNHGVVCNREAGVCYDRFGPSIGLTEAFLGRAAASRLTASLREHPADHRPGAVFWPAQGVKCVRETGPCFIQGQPHAALTAVLYGPGGSQGNSAPRPGP